MAIKSGLKGSSKVRLEIQAPPAPTLTKNKGPRQQAEAAEAAKTPAARMAREDSGCAIKSFYKERKAYYECRTIVRSQQDSKLMHESKQKLTIGRVAKAAQVNVETIRFYQRKGLIPEPAKEQSGFRYYDANTIEAIRFIKRAQTIGFTLEEIKELLAMDPCTSCQQTHDVTLIKLRKVEAKIAELHHIRHALVQLLKECEKTNYEARCPIIITLNDDGLRK